MKRKKDPKIDTGGYYILPDKSHSVSITTRFDDKTERKVFYNKIPDECPICHKGIDARIILAYRNVLNSDIAQVILQCPCQDCLSFFVGYYRGNPGDDYYNLVAMEPTLPKNREFGEMIAAVSPQFIKIYNEARYAEQLHLLQICGAGYRKALEFLIKDYAISLTTNDDQKQIIKKTLLADVIKKYIDNQSIKDNAERAAWLGNDETHYVRIWDDKDLEDLKTLIELTIRWIEMVEMSRKYKDQMPQRKK